MAAELEKIGEFWEVKGNPSRAAYFKKLAKKERAIGGPETVLDIDLQAIEASRISPNIYTIRSVEGLILLSSDHLVANTRKELKDVFHIDFEVPKLPVELNETLKAFAERGITGFKAYFQPGMKFKKDDKFWEGRVRPEDSFWDKLNDDNYPAEVAMLEQGWFLGDGRRKPMYNGLQRYGEDDYMEPIMKHLRSLPRNHGGIKKYHHVPADSRYGASAAEIEKKILPLFAKESGAKGEVRLKKFMEYNFRGNMTYPVVTNTLEWFADPVIQGHSRLAGGSSNRGGLAHVQAYSVGYRRDILGFSPVVFFPSKFR